MDLEGVLELGFVIVGVKWISVQAGKRRKSSDFQAFPTTKRDPLAKSLRDTASFAIVQLWGRRRKSSKAGRLPCGFLLATGKTCGALTNP